MKIRNQFLLECGVKNRNGRIYPEEVFRQAVEKLMEKKESHGAIYGELGHPDSFDISFKNISHKILSIDEKYPKVPRKLKKKLKKLNQYKTSYFVKYEILNTEKGKIAKKNIKSLVPSPRGTGIIDEDGTISNYTLFTVDLINKKDRA